MMYGFVTTTGTEFEDLLPKSLKGLLKIPEFAGATPCLPPLKTRKRTLTVNTISAGSDSGISAFGNFVLPKA